MADLQEKLKSLPIAAGIYLHKNADGKILYVGKAKNLRNRVRQYFQSSRNQDAKTRRLVKAITDFEFIVVDNEVEALVLEYTEEYPKVKELRQGILFIDRESDRLSKVKTEELPKLTLALGKLLVRKVELETDLWSLQKSYKEEHPDVQRAKRKVEIYEKAIAEVLN